MDENSSISFPFKSKLPGMLLQHEYKLNRTKSQANSYWSAKFSHVPAITQGNKAKNCIKIYVN